MATTHKIILVGAKSITEVLDISKEHLSSNGFRIKELHNELICTRGIGFLTAPHRDNEKQNQKGEDINDK
jgi:hypothetical protein